MTVKFRYFDLEISHRSFSIFSLGSNLNCSNIIEHRKFDGPCVLRFSLSHFYILDTLKELRSCLIEINIWTSWLRNRLCNIYVSNKLIWKSRKVIQDSKISTNSFIRLKLEIGWMNRKCRDTSKLSTGLISRGMRLVTW